MKKVSKATFTTLYKKLNSAQREAVDVIEGPVMVIAGPGTGKTQILTLRIANILKRTDTAADSILALTFTESAAFSLRRRLVDIVGAEGYRVRVFTFHGFAQNLIERFPDSFPRIIGGTPIHEAEKILILESIIKENEYSALKPFGELLYYVSPIRQKISALKREGITPQKLKELGERADILETETDNDTEASRRAEKTVAKLKELQDIYRRYELKLAEIKKYDYEDMILEAAEALRTDTELLRALQEEHQYVLADEHQDANGAQNAILSLLAGDVFENPNIFIVGDDKQAIFRFQGASLDHFQGFAKTYPRARIIDLTENYRSTTEILDAAHSVIEKNKPPLGRPRAHLVSVDGAGESIGVAVLPEPDAERFFVADRILRDIGEGIPAEEIAVLARTNHDAEYYREALLKRGVPSVLESDAGVLGNAAVKALLVLIDAVNDFGSDRSFAEAALLPFSNVAPHDFYKLSRIARKKRIECTEAAAAKSILKEGGIRGGALHDLYQSLARWRTKSANEEAVPFLEDLARESGLIAHVIESEDSHESLEALRAFIADIEKLATKGDVRIADIGRYLDIMREYNVGPKSRDTAPRAGRVRVMTAHRAKGLEFERVYVVHANDGVWGNRRTNDLIPVPFLSDDSILDDTEEERRLFYVAMTRAKSRLTVSYAGANQNGRAILPSRFIEEMKEEFVETIDTVPFLASFDRSVAFAPRRHGPSLKDKEVLRELFTDQGLSISAINNYLKSPWLYFFRNLVRIPETPTPPMLYGTAIHAALKTLVDFASREGQVDTSKGIASFLETLERLPIPSALLPRFIEKGTKAIEGYVHTYGTSLSAIAETELKLEVLFDTGIPGIAPLRLRGDLDKVIQNTDGTVTVVDYKTGKQKSRNDIEGGTKSPASGDMKRQLVFYKLLLSRYAGGKYRMRDGIIDFVEPNEKTGKYRQEQFIVTDEDVLNMEEVIRTVAQGIVDLSFWNESADEETTGAFYAGLAELLQEPKKKKAVLRKSAKRPVPKV